MKSFSLQPNFSSMGKNGKGSTMAAPLFKQAVKIDKGHTKSIAKEKKLKNATIVIGRQLLTIQTM
jgi:hypothetical protein